MSESSKLPPLVVDHIRERLTKTIGNKVLAEQISRKFGMAVTGDQVAHARAILKGKTPPRPRVVLKEHDMSGAFETSVAPNGDAQASRKHVPSKDADYKFVPARVSKPQDGNVYFFSGLGLMTYCGVDGFNYQGLTYRTHVLKPAFPDFNKTVHRIPEVSFKEIEIRALATKDQMSAIMRKLEHGRCETKLPLRKENNYDSWAKKWDAIVKGGNISELADISCAQFREGVNSNMLLASAVEALDLISQEFALVHGISLRDARIAINIYSGKDENTRKLMDKRTAQPQQEPS